MQGCRERCFNGCCGWQVDVDATRGSKFWNFKSLVALCSRTSGQLYKPLLVNRNVCLHALPPWPECFDRKLHQLNQPDEHGHHPWHVRWDTVSTTAAHVVMMLDGTQTETVMIWSLMRDRYPYFPHWFGAWCSCSSLFSWFLPWLSYARSGARSDTAPRLRQMPGSAGKTMP